MQFKYLTVVFAAWASLLVAASALPQPEPTGAPIASAVLTASPDNSTVSVGLSFNYS